MIILLGESGSGKSSIEKELENIYNYSRVITYTTRPKREDEQDDNNYHFVSHNNFLRLKNSNYFVETTNFNNWYYGTPVAGCNDNSVVSMNPYGFRQFKKNNTKLKYVSFYIDIPRKDRLIKMLERGDDIEEAYRRNLTDVGFFIGIKDEVDYVIENIGYRHSITELAKIINNMYLNYIYKNCLYSKNI